MWRGSKKTKAAIAIATVLVGATEAVAQETESAMSATFGFSTNVEVDSNRALDEVSLGTTTSVTEELSFGLSSETRLQILEFNATASLRYARLPDGDTEFVFDRPGFDLGYTRFGADSSFGIAADYRTSDVTDAIDDIDATDDDLTPEEGTITRYGASLTYSFGIDAPFGMTFEASTNRREYSDTTDATLVDSETNRFGVDATLQFSPVTQGTAGVSFTRLIEDETDVRTEDQTSYSFGLSHELRQGLTLSGTLGYRETEVNQAGVSASEDGIFASFDAVQELSNGSVSAGVDFDHDDGVETVSLSFGRSMELRDGSISGMLTVTQIEDEDPQLLASVDYLKTLPRGEFSVGLSQTLSRNSDDNDVKFSRLDLGYRQAITSVSSIDLSMEVSHLEDAGAGDALTQTRTSISAAYSHELTEDWDLSVGYRYRSFANEGASLAESNSVFMGLSRSLAFGF